MRAVRTCHPQRGHLGGFSFEHEGVRLLTLFSYIITLFSLYICLVSCSLRTSSRLCACEVTLAHPRTHLHHLCTRTHIILFTIAHQSACSHTVTHTSLWRRSFARLYAKICEDEMPMVRKAAAACIAGLVRGSAPEVRAQSCTTYTHTHTHTHVCLHDTHNR